MLLRYTAGMIWSVSTFTRSKGATTPFSFTKGSISCLSSSEHYLDIIIMGDGLYNLAIIPEYHHFSRLPVQLGPQRPVADDNTFLPN